jgi:hypothetical protein
MPLKLAGPGQLSGREVDERVDRTRCEVRVDDGSVRPLHPARSYGEAEQRLADFERWGRTPPVGHPARGPARQEWDFITRHTHRFLRRQVRRFSLSKQPASLMLSVSRLPRRPQGRGRARRSGCSRRRTRATRAGPSDDPAPGEPAHQEHHLLEHVSPPQAILAYACLPAHARGADVEAVAA